MSTFADLTWLRRAPGAPPFVVAHRGASGLAPENTLAAFRRALEIGAPAVECDVHLTADDVPIVIHDARVDRTTDGTGDVASLRLAELRALDAGRWFSPSYAGERLPTLDEVLTASAGRARVFVELKVGGGAALVDRALADVQRCDAAVAIISFGPEEVRLVAERRPDLPLGFLVARKTVEERGVAEVIEKAAQLGAGFISPQEGSVDVSFVAAAHGTGLPVSVWTVDDPDRMRTLANLGVDAITTNQPDVALALLATR